MPIKESVKIHNQLEIRMVYVDTREEEVFKSMAYASRVTKISARLIKNGLNPIDKIRYKYKDRDVVFRLKK